MMKMAMKERIRRLFVPKSLKYQLLSRLLLILSGLLILIGIFQYVIMSHFLYQNTAANLRSQIEHVPPQAWNQLLEGSEETNPRNNPLFSLNISSIAIVNANGEATNILGFPPSLPKAQYQLVYSSPQASKNYQIARSQDGTSQLLVLEPVEILPGQPPVVLQLGASVQSLRDILLQQLLIFLLLSFAAFIGGFFTFSPILRHTLVPLSQMITKVRRINAGNLEDRLDTDQGQLEIEMLSSSFNGMLERLNTSFQAEREAKENMRQFVADASHELRTPLTSIHGFLEVLLRGAATNPDQLQRALRSMYGESERLTKLVQDLLLLAQLDKEPKMYATEGDLNAVIHDMEPQLRLLAGQRHVRYTLEEHVRGEFDRDRIKQVLLNLFQNAVQHTDETTGEIHVILTTREGEIRLQVQDNGTGISQEHLEHLFERFYRADSARSRKHGGAGLGLAITKSIVESHGGSIHCQSRPNQGTTFTVTLPSLSG